MANQDDVRRIAMTLPGTIASRKDFAFSVDHKGKEKGFAWVWKERIDPKKARVPQPKVLAVRVADQTDKAALLAADPDKFFTEPHYNGFPAVLVRLANVTEAELRRVLVEGWRCMAPKALVAAYDAEDAAGAPEPTQKRKPGAAPANRKPARARRNRGAAGSAERKPTAASGASRSRDGQRAAARTRADRRR